MVVKEGYVADYAAVSRILEKMHGVDGIESV